MKSVLIAILWLATFCLRATINVTNYGCWPDCQLLTNINITMGGTNVSIVGQTFNSASNKMLEVFGGGAYTGQSNMTLICWITNQPSSTNVLVSLPAGLTTTGLSGYYGTDNSQPLSNALVNAASPIDTILFPANTLGSVYLFCPSNALVSYKDGTAHTASVYLNRGGLTFQGQGTVVLQQAGWVTNLTNPGNGLTAERGAIFGLLGGMSDLYPIVFTNLTFFGGETNGVTGQNTQPDSPNTGLGWDESHHALNWYYGSGGIIATDVAIQNCSFYGFRGEVIYFQVTLSSSTPDFLTYTNDSFFNNNVTALNTALPVYCYSCSFHDEATNNAPIIEHYLTQATNLPSQWSFCTFSNVGDVALDNYGAILSSNSANVMIGPSNQFYMGTEQNQIAIEMNSVNNVIIDSNYLSGYNSVIIDDGTAGESSGQTYNFNLLVGWNTFTNGGNPIAIDSQDNTIKYGITVESNNFSGSLYWLTTSTSPKVTNAVAFGNIGGLAQNQSGFLWQFILDETNNSHAPSGYNNSGTNLDYQFNYSSGWNDNIAGAGSGTTFELNDSGSNQIPAGAQMVVSNNAQYAYEVYNGLARNYGTNLPVGDSVLFNWNGTAWTNSNSQPPAPPQRYAFPWNL